MDDIKDTIARTTFALFMEPNMDHLMNLPKGVSEESVLTCEIYENIPKLQYRYHKDMNFGEFNDKTFEMYYKMKNKCDISDKVSI